MHLSRESRQFSKISGLAFLVIFFVFVDIRILLNSKKECKNAYVAKKVSILKHINLLFHIKIIFSMK